MGLAADTLHQSICSSGFKKFNSIGDNVDLFGTLSLIAHDYNKMDTN